ncbi:MAG: MFS transporter [Alistipes sp.]|nr:MFS transporter [Candidatus Minthomonas equi]
MNNKRKIGIRWIVLLCLALPMFASYFFDDIFSTVSHLFQTPELLELNWNMGDYGHYKSAYSLLCVFGGLVFCGILLDKWGVRVTGSVFVGMMLVGAALIRYAVSESFAAGGVNVWLSQFFPKPSVSVAYLGCALFGLGSEIAGVAVNRSISKWFKGKEIALAMGIQLALARLGTATAMLLVPRIVNVSQTPIPFAETARGAVIGLTLIIVGVIVWAVFVALDAASDRRVAGTVPETAASPDGDSSGDEFHLRDVLKVLGNKNFLLIALLCVTFYCCIVSFRKFASAIVIPRFGVDAAVASVMVSMIPFCTLVFAPLFGAMVDRMGHGTRVMVFGACMVALAHLILAFAPSVAVFGYLGIVLLGLGYSLVPAAMWPSVPKLVPEKVLGTAFSLLYWIQNMGLMAVPLLVGGIMERNGGQPVVAAGKAELLFIGISALAILTSLIIAGTSRRHPELGLDQKCKK